MSSTKEPSGSVTALFARASRNSAQVIVPLNDCAASHNRLGPAFFCVHSLSGTAGNDFVDLARHLDPAVRFYGLQAPPRQLQLADFGQSVESIAEHYVESLVQFQPNGPFVLGGYCVGAVIALEMAKNLRARGREVGPLLIIDGVPENTGVRPRRWRPGYWLELAGKLPGWFAHADLMRSRSPKALARSIGNNAYTIVKRAFGLRRGEKLLGGYGIDGIMDLSVYPPEHRSFINRLFGALFTYFPEKYTGSVVVYEAKVSPLLYLPDIGRAWQLLAPHAEVNSILGTHIGMMHEPYVEALGKDIRDRTVAYFSSRLAAHPRTRSAPGEASDGLDESPRPFNQPRL